MKLARYVLVVPAALLGGAIAMAIAFFFAAATASFFPGQQWAHDITMMFGLNMALAIGFIFLGTAMAPDRKPMIQKILVLLILIAGALGVVGFILSENYNELLKAAGAFVGAYWMGKWENYTETYDTFFRKKEV